MATMSRPPVAAAASTAATATSSSTQSYMAASERPSVPTASHLARDLDDILENDHTTLRSNAGVAVLPPPGALAGFGPQFGMQMLQHVSAKPHSIPMTVPGRLTAKPEVASIASTAVQPQCIPPFPFQLTPYHARLTCTASIALENLQDALIQHNIEYDLVPKKWKAKAFAFESTGSCYFIARLYVDTANEHKVVLEFQRRKGNNDVFLSLYDGIMSVLVDQKQIVDPACPAAVHIRRLSRARAQSVGSLASVGPVAGGNGGSHTSLPCPAAVSRCGLARPPMIAGAGFGGGGNDGAGRSASTGSTAHIIPLARATSTPSHVPSMQYVDDDEGVSPAAAPGVGVVPDAAAAVEASRSLLTMLRTGCDDIATPAAQSLASLSASRYVRAAFGVRCDEAVRGYASPAAALAAAVHMAKTTSSKSAAAAVAAATGTQTSPAASGNTSPALGGGFFPAAPGIGASIPRSSSNASTGSTGSPSTTAASEAFNPLLLFSFLLEVVRTESGKAHMFSMDARVPCAIALANFSKNRRVAAVLVGLGLPNTLVDTLLYTGGNTACERALRRECGRGLYLLLAALPKSGATAVSSTDRSQRLQAVRNVDGLIARLSRAKEAPARFPLPPQEDGHQPFNAPDPVVTYIDGVLAALSSV